MSGIRNLTGICQDIHRNRANVDTPPSGPSTSSRSGRYYRRLSQVRRLVVTSAELIWRNAKTNRIYDERNGLWYAKQGDYYLPELALPSEKEKPIGIWGQRHLQYLKEYKQFVYLNLLTKRQK